jgi:hypothetical protein
VMAWCWRAASEALFADHVHPNEKGQALVAKIVARTVQVRRANACASGTCGYRGRAKRFAATRPALLSSRRPSASAEKNTVLKTGNVDVVDPEIRPIEGCLDRPQCARFIYFVNLGYIENRL